jgi:hypothetical protein
MEPFDLPERPMHPKVRHVCDSHLTRRQVLVAATAAAGAVLAGRGASFADGPAVPAVEVMPGLAIYPRDAWGADLPPKGALHREDARFLLIHHTASPSNYVSARSLIRSTYFWHTSNDPTKGWPDVCYEFFVGRDGDVWEGRKGALAGPVVADATGGSQGFAQLVCLLGDFTSAPPTPAALRSLSKVFAWLSGRYSIDISAGATTSFVSRGSQRWPKGQVVTTPTIAGHRDMSYTACPGDKFYAMLPQVRADAHAQELAWRTTLRQALRLGVPKP